MEQATEKPFPEGSDEGDFLNSLTAEAIQYIFEDAQEEVLNVLTNTDNTAEAVAATTYKITKGLLERHKRAATTLEADMSHALALGTEVTDMLVDIVAATQDQAIVDKDKLREEALMRATVMHGEDVESRERPEDKEEAQGMLTNMIQDGSVDQAFNHVNARAREMGVNTNDMLRKGTEQSTGFLQGLNQKNPMAEGVEQGVKNMEQNAMGATPPHKQMSSPPAPPPAAPVTPAPQGVPEPQPPQQQQPLMGG